MEIEKIDNVVTEVIIAYDADTGEALHVHEELTEVVAGARPPSADPDERRERDVMAAAKATFPSRTIKTLVTDPSDAPEEGMRLVVDPSSRNVRKEAVRGGSFPIQR